MFDQNKDDKHYINNHLSFKVMYHQDPETENARIVGFEVIPSRYLSLYDYFYIFLLHIALLAALVMILVNIGFFVPIVLFVVLLQQH